MKTLTDQSTAVSLPLLWRGGGRGWLIFGKRGRDGAGPLVERHKQLFGQGRALTIRSDGRLDGHTHFDWVLETGQGKKGLLATLERDQDRAQVGIVVGLHHVTELAPHFREEFFDLPLALSDQWSTGGNPIVMEHDLYLSIGARWGG
jgi:hypothetical protein